MTLVQILRALGRRWYVVVLGVVLTAFFALFAARADAVYTARTSVTVMAPVGWAVAGNTFTDSATSLVGFASLVERSLTGTRTGQVFAAPETPLYGGGSRSDALVYVPDSGGQWATNLNQPALIVDVVAATPAEVEERMRALIDQIEEVAQRVQDERGVGSTQRITTYPSPAEPVVVAAAPNRVRALGGIVLLGAGATVGAALGAEWFARRRTRRQAAAATPEAP